MPDQPQAVIGGIDCHTDFHVAVALDPLGRALGTESFPATSAGYRSTHGWLCSFGPVAAVSVESTGSYGAALTRTLVEQGCGVIEINQPHAHLRARRGKNDAIDAEAAARKVLSGEATAAAKDTSGIVESIRQLSVARNSAVKARSAALCQLGDLLVTAPATLREQLDTRRSLEAKAGVCARLRPDPDRLADPAQAAKAALRSLGHRIARLGAEADELGRRLDRLVATAAPATTSRLGCGTHHTAALLVAAGQNIDRLGSEASFAHLCGTAPIPASSAASLAGAAGMSRSVTDMILPAPQHPARDPQTTSGYTNFPSVTVGFAGALCQGVTVRQDLKAADSASGCQADSAM
ncbi:MAG: transposase [Acidimicrobiaceae bacterium]|nr:transposase [Acidimicrobiaceae bacterium]